jgi:DMSO/TMAO reductase YedYZ molybdopterin-dependent catalytic subunit
MTGRALPELPVHRRERLAPPTHVRVDGLVGRPLELSPAELAILPQRDEAADFGCLEGWTVAGVRWRGVPVAALLASVEPRAQATWVQASAGEFSVPLPLETAARALLALELDGRPLPPEHGGPVRLLVPGGECFTSVKWLDRLELRSEPAPNTARSTAIARIASSRDRTSANAHR